MTSDEPLPDRCGAKCRDGGYCTQWPVNDSERCRMHGGTQPTGVDSPNFKHGAFSKHFRADLTEAEEAALDDIVERLDAGEGLDVAREIVAETLLKYKRSGDPRFLREARQLAADFGVIETPPDQLELDADVDQRTTHDLDDDTKDILLEVIRRRQETESA